MSWEHIQKNGEFETMELTGKEMDFCTDTARKITDNVARAVVGKKECTRLLLCCLLCGGHALLQDVPGVGKTAALGEKVDQDRNQKTGENSHQGDRASVKL